MDVKLLIGDGGGTAVWAWMGTASETRGTGVGSDKFYAGLVVERPNGSFDGVVAYGKITAKKPSVSVKADGVATKAAALEVVSTALATRSGYVKDMAFLEGYVEEQVEVPISPKPITSFLEQPEQDELLLNALPIYFAMLAPGAEHTTPRLKQLLADVDPAGRDGYAMQPKYNGRRKLIHIGNWLLSSVRKFMRFVSRDGSTKDKSRPLEDNKGTDKFQCDLPGLYGTVLDGEMIPTGHLASEGHSGVAIAAKSFPELLRVVLYDLPAYKGRDLTANGERMEYWERRLLLEKTFDEMFKLWIAVGRDPEAFPFELAPEWFDRKMERHNAIKAGPRGRNEGTILRYRRGLYVQGKAAKNTSVASLWKIKGELTPDGQILKFEDEVIITGYTPAATGKYHGMVGAVQFGQFVPALVVSDLGLARDVFIRPETGEPWVEQLGVDGVVRFAQLVTLGKTSGMNDELRQMFTEDWTAVQAGQPSRFIGKQIMTVTGSWRLPSGAIENVQFEALREEGDKAHADCVWDGTC